MDNVQNIEVFNQFPPQLYNNIVELYTNGKVGVERNQIKILPQYSQRVSYNDNKIYCCHFIIKIPYAGKILQWEVFFNPEDYNSAPDFDFNDEHFLSDPDPDIIEENIPSLLDWNVENPKAFMSVITEFLSLYKKLQLEHLQQDNIFSNLNEEYKNLLSEKNISEDDIEMCVENYTIVHFLISIKVDLSDLPIYLQPPAAENKCLNPYNDTAVLKVSFLEVDGSRVQSSIQLSPRLSQVLNENTALHIAPFTKEQGLNGYVSKITTLLKTRIERISYIHKLKSQYIASLLSHHGFGVIEYDNLHYHKATILCEVNTFFCLVTISLGKKFPDEKPSVLLQSVYHMQLHKPITDVLSICRYSPRWQPDTMVARLFEDLSDAIPSFQKFCQTTVSNK